MPGAHAAVHTRLSAVACNGCSHLSWRRPLVVPAVLPETATPSAAVNLRLPVRGHRRDDAICRLHRGPRRPVSLGRQAFWGTPGQPAVRREGVEGGRSSLYLFRPGQMHVRPEMRGQAVRRIAAVADLPFVLPCLTVVRGPPEEESGGAYPLPGLEVVTSLPASQAIPRTPGSGVII